MLFDALDTSEQIVICFAYRHGPPNPPLLFSFFVDLARWERGVGVGAGHPRAFKVYSVRAGCIDVLYFGLVLVLYRYYMKGIENLIDCNVVGITSLMKSIYWLCWFFWGVPFLFGG